MIYLIVHRMQINPDGDRRQCTLCFGWVDDQRHVGQDIIISPEVAPKLGGAIVTTDRTMPESARTLYNGGHSERREVESQGHLAKRRSQRSV